jgi:DNA polymerase elongation subunit (family B)
MQFYTNVQTLGNNILFRGYENGQLKTRRVPFKPSLFVNGPGGYTSIFGDALVEKRFDNIRDARNYAKQYANVVNMDIYGTTDYVAQYIQRTWPDSVDYDESLINIVAVDIEVKSSDGFPEPSEARHPIDAITIRSTRSNRYMALSLYDYDPAATELELDVPIEHIKFDTEEDLLGAFVELWNTPEFLPDVITGWNSRGFDIPYIINRLIRLFSEMTASRLSPWGKIERRHVNVKGFDMEVWEILGISSIDLMDAFKKFGYKYGPQESYSLNHISHVVLDEKKLSYEEYGNLFNLSEKNPQKYVDYNVKDTDLVWRIEKTTKLISLIINMAYRAGVNYNDCFGTTKIWDTIIYRRLMLNNVVVQPNKSKNKGSYEGAYVKEPIPGKYNWVCSFDLNSLYPNIIAQYNMSPETLIRNKTVPLTVDDCMNGKVPDVSYSVAPNGSMYRKDKQGVIPQIIVEYYDQRKIIQAKQNKLEEKIELEKDPLKKREIQIDIDRLYNEQMSIKILINSLYGALANEYFRHYELLMAEGITWGGQLTIKWAERAVNEYLNTSLKTDNVDYVIAIDTDSLYINLDPLVKSVNSSDPAKFIAKFSDTVMEKVLKNAFVKLFEQQNAFENRMKMSREIIASSGFWTGKKKYALAMVEKDGVEYAQPKLKVTGLQAIQSSTPAPVRKWLKDIFMIILLGNEEDTLAYIENCRTQFLDLEIEDIAKSASVSDVKKFKIHNGTIKKGTPINSRAAVLYNKCIEDNKLSHRYHSISDGDKMKYVYLKLPNPIKQNVIGFKDIFPRELGYDKYIDRDTQFEKVFMKAVEPIMDAVGWKNSPTMDLESFFN